MESLVIKLGFSGDTPASVSLLSLTNASTGADVSVAAGVTLPSPFALANGSWVITFTDTGASLYTYTYRVTWSDATYYGGEGIKRGIGSTSTPGIPAITGITFTFPVTKTISGVTTPLDADSLPLLTDAGGTYGVRRTDTGEVIVAALGGTIDHPATGEYSFTLNSAISGVPYQASAKVIINGVPVYVTDTVTPGSSAGGAGGVTSGIGTVAALALQPFYISRDVPQIPSGTAPLISWTLVNSAGSPVSVSGKALRFVAYTSTASVDINSLNAEVGSAFKYETSGHGITIGAAPNTVSVQFAANDTAAHTGNLRYLLLNTTDMQPLATGRLPIVPVSTDYP